MSAMNKHFSNLMWVEKYRPEKLDEIDRLKRNYPWIKKSY